MLSNVAGQVNIVPEIYPIGGLDVQYLRFEALYALQLGDERCAGLSEIEVYDFAVVNPNKAAGKPIIAGTGAYLLNRSMAAAFRLRGSPTNRWQTHLG